MAKIATTKKLMEEEGVSVQEAERWLDTDASLDKSLYWEHHSLYHPFIMHQMFTHTMATWQKEHNWAIHWGRLQPSSKQDLGVESSAMDLVGPETSWAKTTVIYNDVYQLWRSPGRNPCNEEIGEMIHQEIQDSVKECLQHRWVSTQPEEEPEWSPTGTSTSKVDTQADFQARAPATYDHFKNMW